MHEHRPVSKRQRSLLLSSDAEGRGCLGAWIKDETIRESPNSMTDSLIKKGKVDTATHTRRML